MSIELYNEDCLSAMKRYPDKYFELAIVDPPYGIGNFVQTTGNIRGKKVIWNQGIPKFIYFEQLNRISKNRIIWGANYFNCFDKKGGAIVWIKNQPMPNFSKCDIASCSYHKKTEIYEETWTNFVNTSSTNHPCEKPVKLYEWLLKNYAKEGDKILDTHLGSGSIAIACYNLDFSLTGFEIDTSYFNAAVKRLENHKKQLRIFDGNNTHNTKQ
jgi:site-specific DNA-methyltransferase (adenine-specific)